MKVGDRLKFRLYSGREVDGILRAILKGASGPKLRMEYGAGTLVATINPDQIIPAPVVKIKPDIEF
jgi:hypothetical protein